MFLPKTPISPSGSACRGEQGGQGRVLFFVTYSAKKRAQVASLIMLLLSSQFDLQPRKLICDINDVSGQDVVCREKGP